MVNDPLTELRFFLQTFNDAHRMIVCDPDLESRIKTMIDAYGVAGFFTVRPDRYVPADTVVVMDVQAIEASNRQIMQRWRPRL